jgi:Fe-S cluster biogenesis protein NfuA
MDDSRQQEAARIDQLLEDLRSMAAGPVWQRIEELVQRLVQLYGSGLYRYSAHLREAGVLDEALAARLAGDDLLASLLLLHDLHPWPLERRIAEALERARPQLRSHLGDFALAGVVGDTMRIRLDGGATVTDVAAERLIHRAVADAAPEIARVELEGAIRREPREALVQIGLPRSQSPAGAPR